MTMPISLIILREKELLEEALDYIKDLVIVRDRVQLKRSSRWSGQWVAKHELKKFICRYQLIC